MVVDLERTNQTLKDKVEELQASSNLPNNELIQLRDKVRSHIEFTTNLEKALQDTRQMLQSREEEKRNLELQLQGLNSTLSIERALKDKILSDVTHKTTLLKQLQQSHDLG